MEGKDENRVVKRVTAGNVCTGKGQEERDRTTRGRGAEFEEVRL